MSDHQKEKFKKTRDLDFAYQFEDARFRCNVFMDRLGMGGVFRIIPTKLLTVEQLGLPEAVVEVLFIQEGARPCNWRYWFWQEHHFSSVDRPS